MNVDVDYDAKVIVSIVIAYVLIIYAWYSAIYISYFQNKRTNDILESVKKQNELNEQLQREPLTGLYNRKVLFDLIEHYINKSISNDTCLQLIIIDFDDFKLVNDTYGHACGDEVIIFLSKLLKRYTKAKGYVARYGGEEFAILLPETKAEDALEIADLIRGEIRSHNFPFMQSNVTLSCGIAQYRNEQCSADFFNEADLFLYEAKNTGKNKCISAEKSIKCIVNSLSS